MPKKKVMAETKKMAALSLKDLENAEGRTVEELSKLFQSDTVEDVALQNKDIAEGEAQKKFLAASRGLGHAINAMLMDYEHLQTRWPMIIATLDAKGLKRKLATSGLPMVSGWAKKSINAQIDKAILTELPDLLVAQLKITRKADKKVDVQRTAILASQTAAEQSYSDLADDMIKFRKMVETANTKYENSRKRLKEIDLLLEKEDELSEAEFTKLTKEKVQLRNADNDLELALQTVTQELRATKDGYHMTDLQIGQLTTTLKSINAISTMLKAFLKVTEPIMRRSIVILNTQQAGIDAANLLYALSESINHTLKMCSYGMTVMTQQAVMLGNKDFLEKHTTDEVKQIQAANDAVWDNFTRTQVAKVMEKAKPLLSYTQRAGNTTRQTV